MKKQKFKKMQSHENQKHIGCVFIIKIGWYAKEI